MLGCMAGDDMGPAGLWGALMSWGTWGAVAAATVVISAGVARGDDLQSQVQLRSTLSMEISLRSRLSWKEIGDLSNKEEAEAESM